MRSIKEVRQVIKHAHHDWHTDEHRAHRMWEYVLAFTPGVVYRWWMRWVYRPLVVRIWPRTFDDEVMGCLMCELLFFEGVNDPRYEHVGCTHPTLYDQDEDEEW